MSTLIIILMILITLFIFITIIPLRIKFIYNRVNQKDEFKVNVNALWGLIKFNINEPDLILKNKIIAPVIKIKAKLGHPQSENKIKEKEQLDYKFKITDLSEIHKVMKGMVLLYDSAFQYIMSSLKVYDFIWITRYGFQDPAYTSMAYGAIWGVKGNVFNYLQGKVRVLDRPKFVVKPNFFNQEFSTKISCIFVLRIGHIITAGLKVIVRWIFKRG